MTNVRHKVCALARPSWRRVKHCYC